MTARLTLTVAGYAGFLTVAALVGATRGRRVAGLGGGLIALEALLLLNAVIDVVGQVRGRAVAEPATHGGYLLASVGLMPVLLGVRAPATAAPARTRWDDLSIALVGLVLAVVCVRLHQTAGTAGS